MLSSKIVCSDAFSELPFSAQALYLQLNMEADDDGFLNCAKRIVRTIGATEADLNILLEKRYILGFENGVIVIKHWRMNNQIRKDRYTPTQYQDEFNSLEIKPDGAYTEKVCEDPGNHPATTWQPNGNQLATTWQPLGNQMATSWQPVGNHPATQNREGQFNLVECNLKGVEETDSVESETPAPDTESQKISCQQIVDLYNSICVSFPSVRSLSESRKKAIKARLNQYTLDDFRTLFENAEASTFLKGSNDRNWTATFDWLIKDANMAKVLEGNYADRPKRFGGGGRKEAVPGWCFSPGEAEMEAIQRALKPESTIGNNPDLADRAERLKQSFSG